MNSSLQILERLFDGCVWIFSRHTVYKIAHVLGSMLYVGVLRRLRKHESGAIQDALGVPKIEANKIALHGFLNTCTFLVDYQFLAIKSDQKVFELIKTVEIEGLDNLQESLNSNRPLVLISIHMDSFLIGLLRLCEFTPKNRPITVIKLQPIRKKEIEAYKKFNRLGAALSVLRLRDKPALETLKELRNGNIVLVLCDVDPQLGKTVDVSFLEKPSQFSSGPIELAIAAKAIMMPFVVIRDTKSPYEKHILKMEKPIDPLAFSTPQFSEKTRQMTQELASTVESWITASPNQWQTWGVLPAMWSKK